MRKPDTGKELAEDILERSTCNVQVGAAIEDSAGYIVSWGWNGVGDGEGIHAECHAIQRANKQRLRYGVIYVASKWRRKGKMTKAKPCEDCARLIKKWCLRVCWRGSDGLWYD